MTRAPADMVRRANGRVERIATLIASAGMVGFFGLVLAGIFFPGPLLAWSAAAMGVVWVAAGICAIRLRRERSAKAAGVEVVEVGK